MSQNNLDELAKKARREYMREYREKNKEKIAERTKKYWATKYEKMLNEKENAENENH